MGKNNSPDPLPLERLIKLENKVQTIERLLKKPWYRDFRFWAGVTALPALVLGGWLLKGLNEIFIKNPYFQPLAFIHSMLGTEDAVKAYLQTNTHEWELIREKIAELIDEGVIEAEFTGFLEEEGFREKISELIDQEADSDERGGRRLRVRDFQREYLVSMARLPNFNDVYISQLGLAGIDTIEAVDCASPPIDSELIDFGPAAARTCFVVGENFRTDDSFTLLRPKEVSKIRFEVFLIPSRAVPSDHSAMELEAEYLPLGEEVLPHIFRLHINNTDVEPGDPVGTELGFGSALIAYKYDFPFEFEENENDRTYDIMNVSISLTEYDTVFGDEEKDKSFAFFIVPTFVSSDG